MREKAEQIFQTDIYAITCEELSLGRKNEEVVAEMIKAGIKIIQYREKDKSRREKLVQCKVLSQLCREAGVLFIVNDDVDIALLCEAGGVHVGQEDLPAADVRKLTGLQVIIGVSAETPQLIEEAIASGADYIGIGPVFPTRTKSDAGQPIGLDLLGNTAKNYKIPLVAIGGINEENIMEVRRRGVSCSAIVSDIVGSRDIPAKVAAIRCRLAAGF